MRQRKDAVKARVKVELSLRELVSAIRELSAEDRELFIENLLAATSPEYLRSIEEAREDYRAGRTVSHHQAFED